MSGGRGSPNPGKVRVKVKVVIYRPNSPKRVIWTNLFLKKGFDLREIDKRLDRKYRERFPTAYVYPILVKENIGDYVKNPDGYNYRQSS